MTDNEKYNEFVAKLHAEHPHMFSRSYGGVAVGEGWWNIIALLCSNIDTHVKHRRHHRARDLLKVRAKRKGLDALIKLYQGKKEFATDWQIQQAEDDFECDELHITEKVERVTVAQIKEKFGGLRFYYDGGDEYVSGLVTMAEVWANRTCETCGEKGKQRGGGWIRTLCDKHETLYQVSKGNYEQL